eukprot:3493390-Rhodomonas_salina.1
MNTIDFPTFRNKIQVTLFAGLQKPHRRLCWISWMSTLSYARRGIPVNCRDPCSRITARMCT